MLRHELATRDQTSKRECNAVSPWSSTNVLMPIIASLHLPVAAVPRGASTADQLHEPPGCVPIMPPTLRTPLRQKQWVLIATIQQPEGMPAAAIAV